MHQSWNASSSIGRNSFTWPHLPARESERCSLSVHLKREGNRLGKQVTSFKGKKQLVLYPTGTCYQATQNFTVVTTVLTKETASHRITFIMGSEQESGFAFDNLKAYQSTSSKTSAPKDEVYSILQNNRHYKFSEILISSFR